MTETIIESITKLRLTVFVLFLWICQLACILVGAFIAPAPENIQYIIGTVCKDIKVSENDTTQWFYNRGEGKCETLVTEKERENMSVKDIVYVFRMPVSKESTVSEFLRWQQSLIGVLQINVPNHYQIKNRSTVTIDARLAYRDKGDPEEEWKLYAESVVKRNLECKAEEETKMNVTQCAAVPLFELNCLPHEYYLLNIKLLNDESDANTKNLLPQIILSVITQEEMFTKLWVSLKTVFFITFIVTLCWFYRRIHVLKRKLYMLEILLLSLGITTCTLNLPLEYLLLVIDMPLMLLLTDIRQCLFYIKFFLFWIILAKENMMILPRSSLKEYWLHIVVVIVACILIFIFDIYERGVQLKKPFYSIWVNEWANSNTSLIFLVLSRILMSVYFLYMCYLVRQMFRDIHRKRRQYMPRMSYMRRLRYEGLYERIIFRLKYLMVASMLCVTLTLTAVILGQIADWKVNENIKLTYTSAFFTGIHGMWNLFIFALIVFYAPSHKEWDEDSSHSVVLN